jgi:hypothetical protein
MADNRFKIAGGPAGMKVSWQVTAVRQDRYAVENPLQVERLKPGVSAVASPQPATGSTGGFN